MTFGVCTTCGRFVDLALRKTCPICETPVTPTNRRVVVPRAGTGWTLTIHDRRFLKSLRITSE